MELAILAWLLHTRTGRLVSTFILFILVQIVFAALYFRLYKWRRDSFSFNSDILRRQGATTRSSAERELPKIQAAIGALQEVMSELDRGVRPVVNEGANAFVDLPSGRKCVMVFMSGSGSPQPSGGGSQLQIIDSNGQTILDVDPYVLSFRGWLHSKYWLATPAE